VAWHEDDDRFVLSLWHDDVCVGTAPLSTSDAAEVSSFLVTHLGERGRWAPRVISPEEQVSRPRSQPLMQRLMEWARRNP